MTGHFNLDARLRHLRLGTQKMSCSIAALTTAALLAAPPAIAQDLEIRPSATSLQLLSRQNTAQNDMGRSIDAVCPTLLFGKNKLPGDEKDLQEVCTAMVPTANDILDTGQTENSLKIDTTQTNNALQAINGEELNGAEEQTTQIRDTMVSSLSARLDAIRTARSVQGSVSPGLA